MREYNKTRQEDITNKNQPSLFGEDPKYGSNLKKESLKLEAEV